MIVSARWRMFVEAAEIGRFCFALRQHPFAL